MNLRYWRMNSFHSYPLTEQLEKDLKTANQELSESDSLILKLRQDQIDLQAEITVLGTSLEKAQAELEREKAQLSAYDEELKELEVH